MFTHYLTTALRHFRQQRLTTAINVVCLSIGLACFLAIHLAVSYLKSSDAQFPTAHRTYVLTQRTVLPGSDFSIPMSPYSAPAVAAYLKVDFPQLRSVARVVPSGELPVATDTAKAFVYTAYADPEFLDVFAFSFLAGDSARALSQPFSAVVTEDAATRLFGSALNAMGHQVRLQDNTEVTITGIIAAVAQPSHMGTSASTLLRFDMLISMNVIDRGRNTQWLRRWNSPAVFTYLLLPATGFTAADLTRQLKSFGTRRAPATDCKCDFDAIPLGQVRLATLDLFIGTDKTGISAATLLYALGALVLLVSCLNYANLATAQSMIRAKEIGMRRVVGAGHVQIAGQYLFEAGSLTMVAFATVLLVVAILMSTDVPIPAALSVVFRQATFWSAVAFLVACVSLLAGAYPAFALSRVRPVQAVRSSRLRSGTGIASTLMVGAQFVAASFLLVSILVIGAQNDDLRRSAMQTVTDPLIVLTNDVGQAGVEFDTLQQELLRQPHIQAATAASGSPWRINCVQEMMSKQADAAAARWAVCGNYVNYDFFSALGFQLLAGRAFDRAHADDAIALPLDKSRTPSAVIDAALAEQYGWSDPRQAIGKTLYMVDWQRPSSPPQLLRVVGVARAEQFAVVGLGATSNLYLLTPNLASSPIVRLSRSDVPAALKEVEQVWNQLAPRVAVKWRFANELQNDANQLFGLISTAFTVTALLALAVAVLGLVGMSLHIIGRRTHEIGVRKTLGASVKGIVAMLLRDFSKPVIVANVIAWPLAFMAMKVYLSVFIHHVGLSLLPFAVSMATTVLIAWIAVAAQATRAARLKPGRVLRYE